MKSRGEIVPSKKSRGALLFWTWFNSMGARQDGTDEIILTLSRAIQVQRQRIDVLEKRVAGLSGIVRRDEPLAHFTCISCGHSFDVPEGEAKALDLIEVCPKCYGWAFPGSAGKVYSSKQAAAELRVSDTWIRRRSREHGLGQAWGGGNGTGHNLYFTEDEFRQLRQIPRGKPGRYRVREKLIQAS